MRLGIIAPATLSHVTADEAPNNKRQAVIAVSFTAMVCGTAFAPATALARENHDFSFAESSMYSRATTAQVARTSANQLGICRVTIGNEDAQTQPCELISTRNGSSEVRTFVTQSHGKIEFSGVAGSAEQSVLVSEYSQGGARQQKSGVCAMSGAELLCAIGDGWSSEAMVSFTPRPRS